MTNLPAELPGGSQPRQGTSQTTVLSGPLSRLELQCEGRHPQRAGFALPQAEGDELSGATTERELFAFISDPIDCVGGVPLTRARNP